MDPFRIIVTSLAAGATASVELMAEQAVKDAYVEFKALIQRKHGILVLEALEKQLDLENIQASVAQDLKDVDTDSVKELLEHAMSLLDIVKTYDPVTVATLNINLDEIVTAYRGLKDEGPIAFSNDTISIVVSGPVQACIDWNDEAAEGKDFALEGGNFAVIRVLYATDRDYKPHAIEKFGNDRGKLSLGCCDVSIPRDHRMGELESPSIWRLEFREDPANHVVLLSTVVRSKNDFFAELAARVRDSARSSAFVFIHGYNVTFKEAARRTAQISYDLAFDGAPVFYSWPSQGTLASYTVDEQNIEWAQANLRGFLEEFFARSGAKNVYLIAHSMGSRALTRAVASLLADEPVLRNRLKEVILTAPDIDADVFKRDIVPALTASGSPVTLYASSEDFALVASKQIHGYPRAGDSGHGLVVMSGVETIDATHANTSFMGHSYFAENRSVLSDMFYLIRDGQRYDMRFGLRCVDVPAGRYWEFKR